MTHLLTHTANLAAPTATATERVMTVVLEGEIDRADGEDVVAMVAKYIADGTSCLVLDFSNVTHLDYRSVKPLVQRAEVLRALGGDLKLSGLSRYLHAIFRSAGANDAFDYFATAQDAARSFERSALFP